MTVRERSADLGAQLVGHHCYLAWQDAEEDEFEFAAADAVANILIYAETVLGVNSENLIERARRHVDAELGIEGEVEV